MKLKLKQVFYQESDLVEIINEPIVRTPQDEEPKIIYRKIDYQRKVTCWYSNKLNIGIIQVDLIAQPVYLSGKGYSKKHFSEYPNSAAAIRNAIRLFDEAVAEGLPDRNKTEEEAWEEWRRSQQSNGNNNQTKRNCNEADYEALNLLANALDLDDKMQKAL